MCVPGQTIEASNDNLTMLSVCYDVGGRELADSAPYSKTDQMCHFGTHDQIYVVL